MCQRRVACDRCRAGGVVPGRAAVDLTVGILVVRPHGSIKRLLQKEALTMEKNGKKLKAKQVKAKPADLTVDLATEVGSDPKRKAADSPQPKKSGGKKH